MPRHLRKRAQLTDLSDASPSPSPPLSRPPRRAAARRSEELTSITVDSSKSFDPSAAASAEPDDADLDGQTVRLKMPTNKLRAGSGTRESRESYDGSAASQRAPRSTRAMRSVVIDTDSDEDDDEDDDDDEDIEMDDDDDEEEDDAEGDDDDMDIMDETMRDADADADADGDEDIEVAPPAARRQAAQAAQANTHSHTHTHTAAHIAPMTPTRPIVTITSAGPVPQTLSVEPKEMQMATATAAAGGGKAAPSSDDEEELSELPSDGAGSAGEEDEDDGMGDEEDEELDADGDTDDADGDGDGDIATPGSRDSTPDVTKMTKRQRSRLDQVMGNDFLQLPMEPQIKKHLTAEEHAMRRAEMARRRKNLSEKRNEEEKMDTINRLLKKQAPKRRGKISAAEIAAGAIAADTPDPTASAADERELGPLPADPVFARWISRRDGVGLALPQEWHGVGAVADWAGNTGWRTVVPVDEVEG